jgi:hypothetical protein
MQQAGINELPQVQAGAAGEINDAALQSRLKLFVASNSTAADASAICR